MSITFNHICELLEGIEKVSTRQPRLAPKDEKKSIEAKISCWFVKYRNHLEHSKGNGAAILSAIFLHRRKDMVCGLQGASMSKKLIRLLRLSGPRRSIIEDWAKGTYGDIGACVEKVLKSGDGTFRNPPAISIEEVDRLVLQTAAKYRFSNAAIRAGKEEGFDADEELRKILIKLPSWQAKWLVRLLLRQYPTVEFDDNHLLR